MIPIRIDVWQYCGAWKMTGNLALTPRRAAHPLDAAVQHLAPAVLESAGAIS